MGAEVGGPNTTEACPKENKLEECIERNVRSTVVNTHQGWFRCNCARSKIPMNEERYLNSGMPAL